ncbi:UNKNOWN [Stylonychia lemnae]|uniref:Uncharacterized protein n=1 Tax=Stylonychia lemnae TaxID=5949 RepID=A0A078AW57_STYLE|nr:UNKNOWN [Stylonychia lemnae]|eukprot:CDW85462.1 UNKNOWN [Stylonychia lemnae]
MNWLYSFKKEKLKKCKVSDTALYKSKDEIEGKRPAKKRKFNYYQHLEFPEAEIPIATEEDHNQEEVKKPIELEEIPVGNIQIAKQQPVKVERKPTRQFYMFQDKFYKDLMQYRYNAKKKQQ